MSPWQWWRNRARRENEFDEEIQSHLRMAERDRIDRGETSIEACANVRREFGNVLLTKEVTRAQWVGYGWTSLRWTFATCCVGCGAVRLSRRLRSSR